METHTLTVEGMFCRHCERTVGEAVRVLAGVSSVDVSLDDKRVTVGFDPGMVNLEKIKTAIEDEGYIVV